MFKTLTLLVLKCLILVHYTYSMERPIIIAHRGASGYLPEHTMESKVAALIMGSDYIEQDVVLTRDNVPLVLHDIYLDQVTDVAEKFPQKYRMENGKMRFLAIDFKLNEIKTLKATERFLRDSNKEAVLPNRFPVGESAFQLHTLDEELQMIKGFEKTYNEIHQLTEGPLYKPKKFGIHVELKRPDFHYLENKRSFSQITIGVINRYFDSDHGNSKVYIQCFDPQELSKIRYELDCQYPLIQLLQADGINENTGINYTYYNSLEGLQAISEFADGVGPKITTLLKKDDTKSDQLPGPSDFYKNAKNLNLLIHAYTFRVDKLPEQFTSYNQLLNYFMTDLQVDGIFTDFPDVTSKFVNNKFNSAGQLKMSFSITSMFALIYYMVFVYA